MEDFAIIISPKTRNRFIYLFHLITERQSGTSKVLIFTPEIIFSVLYCGDTRQGGVRAAIMLVRSALEILAGTREILSRRQGGTNKARTHHHRTTARKLILETESLAG